MHRPLKITITNYSNLNLSKRIEITHYIRIADKIINFKNNKIFFQHFKSKLYKKYIERCSINENMFYGVISFGLVSLQEWWTEPNGTEECGNFFH